MKKKANFELTPLALRHLSKISNDWGVGRANALELLIRREYGLPPFEKGKEWTSTSGLPRIEDDDVAPDAEQPDEYADPAKIPLSFDAPGFIETPEPVTVATPWQELPVVRDLDTVDAPAWVLLLAERLVVGEDVPEEETRKLQRWRRGFDDEEGAE